MDAQAELDEVLEPIELRSRSSTRLEPVAEWYAALFGLEPDDIGVNWVSSQKQISARLYTPGLIGTDHPKVAIAIVENSQLVDEVAAEASNLVPLVYAYAEAVVIQLEENGSYPVKKVVQARGSEVGRWIEDHFDDVAIVEVPFVADGEHVGAPRQDTGVEESEPSPLEFDERTRAMVRRAIESSRSVVLVGPPGTGKTHLLSEEIAKIGSDPPQFGFRGRPNPKWVTPDESWTTRELVGGETVDDEGQIRFRPGHLLDAVASDRWLVLDEMNRADMDQIFGPLLTWLSGRDVQVGRATSEVDSPPVELGWANEPSCEVSGLGLLSGEDVTDSQVRFNAGRDWRLLGTYNVVDAQRVFRLGQALGRRFVRVPITPIDEDRFRTVLERKSTRIPAEVLDRIVSLYAAHLDREDLLLGPAVFLRMPRYIRTALDGEVPANIDSENRNIEGIVAEAYLLAAGPWLTLLGPDELDEFSTDLGFPEEQWNWIAKQLESLR